MVYYDSSYDGPLESRDFFDGYSGPVTFNNREMSHGCRGFELRDYDDRGPNKARN